VEENKALVRRWFDEVFNRQDLAVMDEIVAEDIVNHAGRDLVTMAGREGYRTLLRQLFIGFPDWHFEVEDVIAEGDRVVVRTTMRGTHQGVFRGVAATGRRVTWEHIHIFRVIDGKLAEHWACRNDIGILQQLGAFLPEPRMVAWATESEPVSSR
jgi:steroid delta-isomerase-like uncharacterized protein